MSRVTPASSDGQVLQHLADHEVEVHLGDLEGAAELGVVEDVVDQVGHPGGALDGAVQQAGRLGAELAVLELLADQRQREGQRGERGLEVVADLAGEERQPLVGALELGLDAWISIRLTRALELGLHGLDLHEAEGQLAGAQQLEDVDDPSASVASPASCVGVQLARLSSKTQRVPNGDARLGHQRVRDVEAHVPELAGHERVVARTGGPARRRRRRPGHPRAA